MADPVPHAPASPPPLVSAESPERAYLARLRLPRLLSRCLAPFGTSGHYALLRRDLTKPLAPYRIDPSIVIAEASEAEMDSIGLLDTSYGDLRDAYRARLRRGHRCFAARIGPDLVGYAWLHYRMERLPGCVIALRDGEVYFNDAYTAVPWRGRGVHPALHHALLRFVQETGSRFAYTLLLAPTDRVVAYHRRQGWDIAGTMICFRPHRATRTRFRRLTGSLGPCVNLTAGGRAGRGDRAGATGCRRRPASADGPHP